MKTMQLYFNSNEDMKHAVKVLLDCNYTFVYDGKVSSLVVETESVLDICNSLRLSKQDEDFMFTFSYEGSLWNQYGVTV